MHSIAIPRFKNLPVIPVFMTVTLAAVFIFLNPSYLITDTYFYVGFFTLALTFKIDKTARSYRFGMPLAIIILFNLFFESRFGEFSLVVFTSLLIMELGVGKLSLLTLFHLFLLSPLFKYFIGLITFPMRIEISKIVVAIISLIDKKVSISGNLIYFNGSEFLVDKACMGLYMIGYSFIIGLLILSTIEKNRRNLNFYSIIGFLALLLALNVLGNITRATLFVLFKVMPNSPMHDILGLIIFALYILAPFYLIVNRYSKTRTTLPGKEIHLNSSNSLKVPLVFLFLVSLTLLLNKKEINENKIPPHENSILGYKQSTLDGNILKYTNENTLIYIKPPVSFYKADHNPLICWEGSGYSFRKVDTIVIKGIEIYFAELEKDGDKLYTSWWFQHQNQITNNQWEWRWNTLKSDYAYNMVNVTASTFQEMKTTAEMMMMTVETQ